MIVLDEDRQKPIYIKQSIFFFLLGVFVMGTVLMIAVLATARNIDRGGGRASILDIVGLIVAKPIPFLILAVITIAPSALLIRRCCWRVDVSNGVLTYRSLFRSRSVRTADINRVRGSRGQRGRADFYKLFLSDGTSIAMHDVAGGSLMDLARFEDESICKIPQIEMKSRLFGKIVKSGYTEYL